MGITAADTAANGLDERLREFGVDAIVEVRLLWERAQEHRLSKLSAKQRRCKRQREAETAVG